MNIIIDRFESLFYFIVIYKITVYHINIIRIQTKLRKVNMFLFKVLILEPIRVTWITFQIFGNPKRDNTIVVCVPVITYCVGYE